MRQERLAEPTTEYQRRSHCIGIELRHRSRAWALMTTRYQWKWTTESRRHRFRLRRRHRRLSHRVQLLVMQPFGDLHLQQLLGEEVYPLCHVRQPHVPLRQLPLLRFHRKRHQNSQPTSSLHRHRRNVADLEDRLSRSPRRNRRRTRMVMLSAKQVSMIGVANEAKTTTMTTTATEREERFRVPAQPIQPTPPRPPHPSYSKSWNGTYPSTRSKYVHTLRSWAIIPAAPPVRPSPWVGNTIPMPLRSNRSMNTKPIANHDAPAKI
mmetsp:Transcript_15789/g.34179  ORF Transcript_15789/g.34179 Transcript_15789/m.34179 type:complete len:265 (+) Transcript_15789:76-870(+)